MNHNEKAAHLEEKKLGSEEIYHGRILHVTRDTVLLENGTEAIREVIHHPGGACVVALTDAGEVLMVRQFRYPHAAETLELPAGKLEYGEDPLTCATRELREEAGASAPKLEPLGYLYPTPAYDKEVIYMYLARNLTLSGTQDLDTDEFLDVVRVPLREAVEMVMRNELPDAKTQIALLKAARLLEQEAQNKAD
ncbi:MAG TPA: ADP-ribose pyrophosphatase [Ruminococcus sp.]|nr:ADP-ribose pyrophosphatase [Ruminococcus sp.]